MLSVGFNITQAKIPSRLFVYFVIHKNIEVLVHGN
jgi:hypothetical protein